MRHNKTTEEQLEKSISSIGAKIADANDLSDEINKLNEEENEKLKLAQEELEDLYVTLDEIEHQMEEGKKK